MSGWRSSQWAVLCWVLVLQACYCSGPNRNDGGLGGGGAAGGVAGGSSGGGGGGSGGAGGLDAGDRDAGVDAGVPQIEVVETALAFGTVDCGATPPELTATVRNSGTAPLSYQALIEGFRPDAFTVIQGKSGTLAAGASAQIRVRAVMRFDSPGQRLARLRIDSTDLSRTPTVPLSLTPRGPFFNEQSDFDFGSWPVGSEVTSNFAVLNVGDVGATVSVSGLQGDFRAPDGGAVSAVSVPAGTISPPAALPITFRARAAGSPQLALTFSSSVPPCSGLSSAVRIRGEGTVGAVTGLADIDFGKTDCGSQAAAQQVRIGNSGSAAFQVTSATLRKGASSPFTLSGVAPGMVVMPGAALQLVVSPKPIPVNVQLPADFSDLLEVTTNVPGDAPHLVRLSQTARGGVLVWDTAPPELEASLGQTTSTLVRVRNLGNGPVTVDAASQQPFAVTAGVAGTSQQEWTVSFAPGQPGTTTDTLILTNVRGALCAPLPAPLPLRGTGRALGLTVLDQSVRMQPTCGSTAGAQGVVRVLNNSNQPITVSARFVTSPSPFELVDAAGASAATVPLTVNEGGVLWLTARLRQPQVEFVEDLLSISTTILGDVPRLVRIEAAPTGARVSLTAPATLLRDAIGEVQATNNGTTAATVSLTANSSDFLFPSSMTVPPLAQIALPVSYIGNSPTDVRATLTATVADPACGQPAPITLVGRALSSQLRLSRSSLDFGVIPCGSGAPPSQTVTLTNSGTASSNWAFTPSAAYEVLPLNGTLGPGQSVELSVTHRGFTSGAVTLTPERVSLVIVGGADRLPLELRAQAGFAVVRPVEPVVNLITSRVPGTGGGRLRFGNSGTLPSTLRFTSNASQISAGSLAVFPGEVRSVPLLFAPTDAGTQLATLTPSADNLCAASLQAVQVQAEAFTTPILQASRPAFELPTVFCETPSSTTATVELRNPTPAPVPFTATWSGDAGAMVVMPASGTVPANESIVLQVTVPSLRDVPVVPTGLAPAVRVSSALGTLELPVDVSPRGAEVLGEVASGASADERLVLLMNVGNQRATINVSFQAMGGASVQASVAPSPVVLEPLSSTQVTVTRTGGSGAGELRFGSVTGGGALCRAPSLAINF